MANAKAASQSNSAMCGACPAAMSTDQFGELILALVRLSGFSLDPLAPSPDGDAAPDGLNQPERPGALQEPVDRGPPEHSKRALQ